MVLARSLLSLGRKLETMEGKTDFQGAFYKNRKPNETGVFVKTKNGTIR
jgi:hypothetical protein